MRKHYGNTCRRCGKPRLPKRSYCADCFAEYMRLRREGNLHPFGGYQPPVCSRCSAPIQPEQGLCQTCRAAYMREYNQRPEVKARHQARNSNAEYKKYRASIFNKWKALHPGRAKEIARKFRAANRAMLNARHRAEYIAGGEARRIQLRISSAAWKKRNPERNRSANHTCYARRRKAVGRFTAGDLVALDIKQEGICALCNKSYEGKYSVDHIVPLALIGKDPRATNWPDNLQLTHLRCNMIKNARLISSVP